jgi:orotate phosphoribosyltransferase
MPWMCGTCPNHIQTGLTVDQFARQVQEARRVLRAHQVDAIAATGHSGLPLAGAIALATRLPIIAVRRPEHAGAFSFHNRPPDYVQRIGQVWLNYAIVDDLVDTGGTICHIIQEVWKHKIVYEPLPAVVLLHNRQSDLPTRLWIDSCKVHVTSLRDICVNAEGRQRMSGDCQKEIENHRRFHQGIPIARLPFSFA